MRILLSFYFLVWLLPIASHAMAFDSSQEEHIKTTLEIFRKISNILDGNTHIPETQEELFKQAHIAIAEGANVNAYFSSEGYQLHYPLQPIHTYLHVFYKYAPIVKFLLLHHANPNAQDHGETALHLLVRHNDVNHDSVRLLLEAGANMNIKEKWAGKTPLMIHLERSIGNTGGGSLFTIEGKAEMGRRIALTKLFLSYGIDKKGLSLMKKGKKEQVTYYFYLMPKDLIDYFEHTYYQEPFDVTVQNDFGETTINIVQNKFNKYFDSLQYIKEGYQEINDLLHQHAKKYSQPPASECTIL